MLATGAPAPGNAPATPLDARAATLALLARRAAGATICPSEVARALVDSAGAGAAGREDWRGEMPAVHAAVDALVAEGLVRLSWKGEAKALREGAYRIGRAGSIADRTSNLPVLGIGDHHPNLSVSRMAGAGIAAQT